MIDAGTLLRPELTELNRLPSRAPLEPYESAAEARAGRGSPWRRSLDGSWKFRLVDRPEQAPTRWMLPSTSDAGWRTITVPGCWTRQDTGDLPHYTNIQMPWPGLEAPATPADNPTGLHRTTFRVPRSWRRRDVIVHLGGAESVAVVFCNGAFVGMGKDSRLPSEFDLTSHLVEGDNHLAIMVIRYSDATWIEDQDHWWHAGLHRSVHLEARSPSRLDDLVLTADYEPTDGSGSVTVTGIGRGDRARQIRVALETLRGRRVGASRTTPIDRFRADNALERVLAAYTYAGPRATIRMDLPSIDPWTAEKPNRYRVLTELLDADGEVVEAHSTLIGFRRVEVADRRVRINGRPIVIHGVNRHDHHPDTGKTVTAEELRAELTLMKQHNINAVRTAHYPNDHRLLDLCDELGLYVIGEANCESHGRLASLSHDPRYAHAIEQRTTRMILRDRNHPSVIGWSLGNESGDGAAFAAAAAWARRVDPSRFVHYEGGLMQRFGQFGSRASRNVEPSAAERQLTDVVCPMYESIDNIVDWAKWAERTGLDDRPLVLCEFSHAMGNSNGSIADYVEAFHTHPALGGGFVWDWRDQGLAERAADGTPFWAYGGHFGDERNDANFCINGLVGPDLLPHPGLREYQWACRPVVAEPVRGRRIRFRNRRVFTSTADLRLHWATLVDGETVEDGTLDVDIAPGAEKSVAIPGTVRPQPGAETHLRVEWRTRRAIDAVPRGHVVAWDDLDLSPAPAPARPPSRPSRRYRVELANGGIAGVWIDERLVVDGDITASLWRAPTDNDGILEADGASVRGPRAQWTRLGLEHPEVHLDSFRASRDGTRLELRRRIEFAGGIVGHHTVVHIGDGIAFRERVDIPREWTDLPRVGVRFEAPPSMGHLEWFGLGPDETYPDRRAAALVGRWRSTIDDQYHPFAMPQEHGAHVDTRWFALTDGRGRGISVGADRRIAFSARRHHDAQLTMATTLAEVQPGDATEVHVDAAIRGLGTGACGPDTLPRYRVDGGRHTWTWQLTDHHGKRTRPST